MATMLFFDAVLCRRRHMLQHTTGSNTHLPHFSVSFHIHHALHRGKLGDQYFCIVESCLLSVVITTMKFSLSWCICGKGVGDAFAHEYHWGCVEKDGAKEWSML
jgi:hypothetical protein